MQSVVNFHGQPVVRNPETTALQNTRRSFKLPLVELLLHYVFEAVASIFTGKRSGTPDDRLQNPLNLENSRLERMVDDYWPAIRRGFYAQVLTFILGCFLLDRYQFHFIFICLGLWIIPFVLMVSRPNPNWTLRFSISVFPVSVFCALYLLEHHQAS